MEETTDVKQKTTLSIPANYVTILQLRERWIKEKERNQRKEQEEKDEERQRNQHAEEQQKIEDDPKKPREDLDEMRLNQSDQKKHRGGNSKKDESTDGGEARWGEEEEEETAAIGREKGEGDGIPEKKKRGRRKRYPRKKKKEVEECGSIKPLECTVKEENNTPVKHQQLRVYRKKEKKAMGNKSVEKAATVAVETQFKDLSIQRGQETKKLKAQTRKNDSPLGRVGMPIESAAMVWVKKG